MRQKTEKKEAGVNLNSISLQKAREGRPKKLEDDKAVLEIMNLCHTLSMTSSYIVHEIELKETVSWDMPKIQNSEGSVSDEQIRVRPEQIRK